MFGLLNVDKPPGLTSREVVNHVQRLARPHKVGHAGTLDPMATGVLVVCVGQATRLNPFVQQLPKSYHAAFQLGRRSDTEDIEGEVIELGNPPHPSVERVREVVSHFHGEVMQRPPAFSAVKVKGQRAYARARRGEQVNLEPRPVRIHHMELLSYEYPTFELQVTCGSGTYIRSLGRDLAESLGSAAVMSGLQRTAVGPLSVEEAVPLEEITAETVGGQLLPAALAVQHLPQVQVSAEAVRQLGHGRLIHGALPPGCELGAAIDAMGDLVALVSAPAKGRLKPHRFFPRSGPV